MRGIKAVALLALALYGVSGTAQAAPVVVGSPLTQAFSSTKFNAVGTVANLSFPEPGANVVSPVTGAVIAWHVTGAEGGPFRLRVLRPTGSGSTYLGAGTSAPAAPAGTGLETFSTTMPIAAGDLIALDNSTENDRLGTFTPLTGSSFAAWVPSLADGTSSPPNEVHSGREVGFNAIVQPAPTLVGFSPTKGSIKGGTTVTISGTDFANLSGVSFGGVPATGVTVLNEGQLTAVAPKGKVGTVDVTVTTIAGTTPLVATDKFTYKGCVVPKLEGKKLKAAKKKLRKAGCKVGKVKLRGDTTAKTGKVVKQSRKPGKQFAPGTKVNVTLG